MIRLHPSASRNGGRRVGDHPGVGVPAGGSASDHDCCTRRAADHVRKRDDLDSGITRSSHVYPTTGCLLVLLRRPHRGCQIIAVPAVPVAQSRGRPRRLRPDRPRPACVLLWSGFRGQGNGCPRHAKAIVRLDLGFLAVIGEWLQRSCLRRWVDGFPRPGSSPDPAWRRRCAGCARRHS
jgi:hypothetical protein